MSRLNIIRASAGSGKTHYLTGALLKILIREPVDYFRHILAVTFTNKATGEMKSRLLEHLSILAEGRKSDYLELLIRSSGYTEEHIRGKASALLKNILHGYSWLNIETIDTFFQRIVRSFTRELAIAGNYNIEIDTEPVIRFAVEELLSSLTDNTDLLNWLTEFSLAKIDEGKSWDIKDKLLKFSKEVFKERFSVQADRIYEALKNREGMNKFKKNLEQTISEIQKKAIAFGNDSLNQIRNQGLDEDDFFKKSMGIMLYYKKLAAGEVLTKNAIVEQMLADPDAWPNKQNPEKEKIRSLAHDYLIPRLSEYVTFIEEHAPLYHSAKEISKNIYTLGILTDINAKISQYRTETNSFILNDSAVFINRIIENNDTPFIYEKTGNWYHHFLIDEFQDTSELQWENFKPLVSNSLSNGNECLLVGDAKQSIYRWRNSNWSILAERVQKEFLPDSIHLHSLQTNWRSADRIIDFNNYLFSAMAVLLQDQLNNKMQHTEQVQVYENRIRDIYSDVQQKHSTRSARGGKIVIRGFSAEIIKNSEEYYQQPLLDEIDNMLRAGFRPGEIAILVREKSEGQLIANFLIAKNAEQYFNRDVQIISNESLFISTSNAVNLLIACMCHIINPDDMINRGKLVHSYRIIQSLLDSEQKTLDLQFEPGCISDDELLKILPSEFIKNKDSFTAIPLYELAENLIRIFSVDKLEMEISYIHVFLDMIHDYVRVNPGNIMHFLEYWDDEGNTRSVTATDTQDAIQILTIHKSKGLQFRGVLVPFCNWALFKYRADNYIWTSPQREVFSYLPLIPLSITKNLINTDYASEYYDEMFKTYVDNLNLLYVALTRAVDALILFPVYKDQQKKEIEFTTVGDLVYHALIEDKESGYYAQEEDSMFLYETGDYNETKEKTDDIAKHAFECSSSVPYGYRLYFNPSGHEFFADNLISDDPKFAGRTMHYILSGIIHYNNIDTVIKESVFEGILTKEKALGLQQHIDSCMQDPQVRTWFDGSGKVMNEIGILIPGGGARRPDRIVVFEDRLEIIDYKFGSEEHKDAHVKQVKEYMQLATDMGYSSVNGYLWYVNQNKVIRL